MSLATGWVSGVCVGDGVGGTCVAVAAGLGEAVGVGLGAAVGVAASTKAEDTVGGLVAAGICPYVGSASAVGATLSLLGSKVLAIPNMTDGYRWGDTNLRNDTIGA